MVFLWTLFQETISTDNEKETLSLFECCATSIFSQIGKILSRNILLLIDGRDLFRLQLPQKSQAHNGHRKRRHVTRMSKRRCDHGTLARVLNMTCRSQHWLELKVFRSGKMCLQINSQHFSRTNRAQKHTQELSHSYELLYAVVCSNWWYYFSNKSVRLAKRAT